MTPTAFVPRLETPPGVIDGWHRSAPDLVAPGFRLREPRLTDAEYLASTFGPEAASTLGVAAPGSVDEWAHFVAVARADRAARRSICYALVPDGSAGVAGLVLVQRLVPASCATTMSFAFLQPQWQTDLPARSLACVLAFAFDIVGVGRVEGRTVESRDADLAYSLGAVAEGVLRQSLRTAEGCADQILWSVLKGEWDERRVQAAVEPVRVDGDHPRSGVVLQGSADEPPAWTAGVPTLRGSLVTLREIDLLDASVLLNAFDRSDLEIALEPAPATRDDFRRYIAWVQMQRALGRAAGFVIIPRGTRHAAGLIQVRLADAAGASAEWGIVVASRIRGTGAAGEAARLLADFAFETLGVARLEARASGVDPSSVALLRKMGAVREAHLRRSFVRGSDVIDDDLWAILASDWRARHPAPAAWEDRVPVA